MRTLENPLPGPGDSFGEALAVFGSKLAVGAPLEETTPYIPDPDSGSVYIFDAATGAQEVVEDIAHLALRSDAGQWDTALASGLAVRLAVQRGDLATAEGWWKKGGFADLNTPPALEDYPYHIFEYLALSQARFLMVRGQETGRTRDIKQSLELLGILLAEAERFQRGSSLIQILILQAIAQSALGNERATKTLLRALALGEPWPDIWPSPDAAVELARLEPGRPIRAPEILFRKVEDAEVAEWTERFGGPES